MITCDLIGRLGNQMFQIAATAATAWRNGTDFAFPTKALGSYTGETYFPHLPIAPKRYIPVYREMQHSYKPIPSDMKDAKLHGYWQSEKYFSDYREQVIELFQMPPILQPFDCSLHIRLGDYIHFKDKHPPVTLQYIDNALDYMHHTYNILSVLVFSDDIEAATAMIKKTDCYGTGMNFVFCQESDPKKSIQMMAGCRHNIIANSSFSWWSAYLGDQESRQVVAPKLWFGPGNLHLDSKDVYRQNWIII